MPNAPRHFMAAVLVVVTLSFAASPSVFAQVAVNPAPPNPITVPPLTYTAMHEVQIQIQPIDVTPDELAKAEQAAALPPATAGGIAARLQTALVGPGANRLRSELAKSRPSLLLDRQAQMVTPNGVAASFSSNNTSFSVEPRLQPDGRLALTLVWKETPPVTVTFTAASGQLAVVALPSPAGKPARLVFLTARLIPDVLLWSQAPGLSSPLVLPNGHNPADINVYPQVGTDPNRLDQMRIPPPDVRDPLSILPSPAVVPLTSRGGK